MKTDITLTFGERVREIRRSLSLKQKEFAKDINLTGLAISEIENGKFNPGYDFLYRVSKVYNVNLHYLIMAEGEMFKPRPDEGETGE